jgi:CBS domain-containing protein
VVDRQDGFLGVFSERYAMSLLIQSAYEGVPSPRVGAFMNTDAGRIVGEETPVMEIARIFLSKYYRRLPVVRDGRLVGQISRRDLLGRNHNLTPLLRRYEDRLLEHSGEIVSRGGTAAGGGRLDSSAVAAFMDREARTVTEDIDLLAIAQIFQQTNARRLPVVQQGRLVGQISRRDVLVAAHDLMSVAPKPERALLYLSAVLDRTDVPPIP